MSALRLPGRAAMMLLMTPQPYPYRRMLSLIALAFALGAMACDLPQDGATSDDADVGESDEVTGEVRTWRLLKLIDQSPSDETSTPGLDLDALVVIHDGAFVSAGCSGVPTLFEGSEWELSDVNEHSEPEAASLHARDGDSAHGGFVSLSGGVLLCELPVGVKTGAVITIFDLESDGDEPWEVRLAADAASDYEVASSGLSGTAEFVVP